VQPVHHVARVDDSHDEHGAEAADELGDPVRDDIARGELPGDREARADGRVEVPAGEMPERGDRQREAKPKPAAIPSVPIASRPMSMATAIPLKPRKKKRNVPSASPARRTPSG
jgi:hypothetical protein